MQHDVWLQSARVGDAAYIRVVDAAQEEQIRNEFHSNNVQTHVADLGEHIARDRRERAANAHRRFERGMPLKDFAFDMYHDFEEVSKQTHCTSDEYPPP